MEITPKKTSRAIFLAFSFLFTSNFVASAQCGGLTESELIDSSPSSETFTLSGTCNIDLSTSINIIRDITIDGTGTLNFTGTGDDDITISDGASLTLGDGTNTMSMNMTGDGTITVASTSGQLTIQANATLVATDDEHISISVEGRADVYGTLQTDGIIGTTARDLNINGGEVYVHNGGELDLADDLKIFNSGYLEVMSGGIVNIEDELVTSERSAGEAAANVNGAGVIVIDGTLNADKITVFDTNPENSSITGSGDITVTDTFSYGETDGSDFSGCNPGTCSGGSSLLPVTLTSFSGELINQNVHLSWETASEKENDYFSIERSINGLDWVSIGEVNGHGNSNSSILYSYVDDHTLDGIAYYRLRQVDFDGTFEVFPSISINTTSTRISVYPNPTQSDLTAVLDTKTLIGLELYNNNGQIIELDYFLDGSVARLQTSKLSPGFYTLKVVHPGSVTFQRIVRY